MKNTFLFLLLYSITISSCKDKCESDGGHVFEIPVTLSPARDTFNIGDTITVTSIFPDEVRDTRRDMNFKLKDYNFFPSSNMIKIDTLNYLVEFGDNFDVLIDTAFDYSIFNYSSGNEGLIGDHIYADNTYSLSYKLVTRKEGLYFFKHFHQLLLSPNQDFEGKCAAVESIAHTRLNDRADNNIDMLTSSPDPSYSEILISNPERYHNGGGYCFYVRE